MQPTLPFNIILEKVNEIPGLAKMLEVICRSTGMGFAALARVTDEKWIACSVRDEICFGLKPGEELVLETTICNEIRQHHEAVIIDEVNCNPQYVNHHTPAQYGFQSYISVPVILKSGAFFGTLCAIDPKPAKLDNVHIRGMFELFADLLSLHLSGLDDIHFAEKALKDELENAELREQFIAILGHDLRNPLGAVMTGAQFLINQSTDENTERVARLIHKSSHRMNGLIENMLDFAKGRLGGGIIADRRMVSLEPALQQVIQELMLSEHEKVIETKFELSSPINVDVRRIAQLVSNLLNNALKFGSAERPISIIANSTNNTLILSVENAGDPISPDKLARIFQPYVRGNVRADQQGMGLGLYIADQIARSHGGKLEVASNASATIFTLRIED